MQNSICNLAMCFVYHKSKILSLQLWKNPIFANRAIFIEHTVH